MYHTNKKDLEKYKAFMTCKAEEKERNHEIKDVLTNTSAIFGFSIVVLFLTLIITSIILS